MKTLYNRVRAVEKLFRELDFEINNFQSRSGLKCLKGCSLCCKKPDIDATALEFLPFAYYAFKNSKAEEYYEQFKNNINTNICNFYNPFLSGLTGGGCSVYFKRGLICRLFGFSAVKNKYEQKQIVTCGKIKENFSNEFQKSSIDINNGLKIPMMNEYYLRLYNIDPNLASKHYPINTAVIKSLEYVLAYYSFRKKSA
jgi:Fe-S-cluster containining protein